MFDPDFDIFAEVIAAGSLSAAARALRVSPASLSKRLVRLEGRLGARLAHRTTRRLTLTPAGRNLLDTLLPIREALKEAEERISGRGTQVAGPLRLTAPTSFGRMHLAPCLPEFLTRHPAVELSLDLTDQFVDLLDGEYDLAIRIAAKVPQGMVSHLLATCRRVLCASPGYLTSHGAPKTLADLSSHRLLAATGQLPWHLDGPQGSILIQGTSWITTNSSEVVRELALRDCGVALRSMWDVAEELDAGLLERVLPRIEGSQDVAIFAVHAPTPRLPANVRALIGHLQKQLGLRKGIGPA